MRDARCQDSRWHALIGSVDACAVQDDGLFFFFFLLFFFSFFDFLFSFFDFKKRKKP